jgi:hypothetical protein
MGTGVVIGLIWMAAVGLYGVIGLASPSGSVPPRPISDTYLQSAHPLMYVLPGKFSWGEHGDSWLLHLVPRAVWVNLYLGLSVLALAAVAVVVALRRQWRAGPRWGEVKVAIALAGLAAAAGFAFSLPPTYRFGDLVIPTPNYLVAHTVTALRAGQRFVMPITIATATLAGLGAWLILRRLRPKWQWAVAAGLMVVIGCDLWALPPGTVTRIPAHASLAALRHEPAGPVVQYYQGSLVGGHWPQVPCMLQNQHEHRLMNDCGLGRSHLLGQLLEMPLCQQLATMRAAGVRYLIVEPSDTATLACAAEQQAIKRPVAEDPTYQVFELRP